MPKDDPHDKKGAPESSSKIKVPEHFIGRLLSQIGDIFRGVGALLSTLNQNQEILSELLKVSQKNRMKLDELLGRTENIQAKLNKVFGEQQALIDDLKAKNEALRAALDNTQVPEGVTARLDEIDTLLQKVDDTIPDVEPAPPGDTTGTGETGTGEQA